MLDETAQNIDISDTTPEPVIDQTAQVPPIEPLPSEPVSETKQVEPEPESVETDSVPVSSPTQAEPVSVPKPNLARDLLNKARFAIQTRKRVKLDRIMTLFTKRTNITNDEVEKFLHVSDATATRYLEILEKENKIKQTGKTGKGVTYTKI
jgi:predicted HTH transcriptional regulator